MRLQHTLITILLLCITNLMNAQITVTDSTTLKNDNFLDMGANVLTQTFGSNLDGNVDGKSAGFLELLDKMDLPEEQKTQYKNQYYLQAKELTQKQKDSLGKAIEKAIMEAEKTKD